MYRSVPVKWYLLIRDMELFTRDTGQGLAYTWGLVHNERYEEAVNSFDKTRSLYEQDHKQ